MIRSYLSPHQKEDKDITFPEDLKLLREIPVAPVIHEEELEPMSQSMSEWITRLLEWCRDTDHEVVVSTDSFIHCRMRPYKP